MRMNWLTCPKCTGETPERLEPSREPEPARHRASEPAPSREPEPARYRAPEPAPSREPEPVRYHAPEPAPLREPEPVRYRAPEPAPSREPESAAAARWVLVGIEGAVKGRRIELAGERIKLGKAPEAEDGARIEVLDDPYMSREHMVIERRGGGWHLRDVGSRNGTAVNEERVDEHTLQHGDVIRAGQLALRVEVGSGV